MQFNRIIHTTPRPVRRPGPCLFFLPRCPATNMRPDSAPAAPRRHLADGRAGASPATPDVTPLPKDACYPMSSGPVLSPKLSTGVPMRSSIDT
jgi:hypothetical protein